MADQLIHRLSTCDENFAAELDQVLSRGHDDNLDLQETVRTILTDVRVRGDEALLEYTRRFDHHDLSCPDQLEVPRAHLDRSLEKLPGELRRTLEESARRIEFYHQQQLTKDWQVQDEDGNLLGQLVRPLERVGVYVPGGKASYPSSVLMNAIPARVAGVSEMIMTVPAPSGELPDIVLGAAAIAGVHRVFAVGGAQAIAALSFGTQRIPRVDKIVGPGNRFVAEAKRQVYGQVGLDMTAGPSEVLIIADGTTPAEWVAFDLFAQAEHDEEAQPILLSFDSAFIDRVEESLKRLLPKMVRREIIAQSLSRKGALILVRDIDEAVELSNRIAPEHLELSLEDPEVCLERIRNAGAVFVGPYSAEVFGDYCAGPSHVLPTSGTARHASPLDVSDFLKRTSLVQCSAQGASRLARLAATLAESEGLGAHACSARCRYQSDEEL